MKRIERFRGEYRFLSNFWPAKVHADWDEEKVLCPTLEHAYQAMKAMNRKDFDAICALPANDPGAAKAMGRAIVARPAWNDPFRLELMEKLLREKFSDPVLRDKLLATGDAELIEGNFHNDIFFGVCRGVGENHLGKLLMKIRAELKERAS